MSNETRQPLEKRAQKAILQESFFRIESAIIIALTIILAAATTLPALPTSNYQPAAALLTLLFGAIVEAILVYSSLTDETFGEKVVAKMLRDSYEPAKLKDKSLQQQMNDALEYYRRINHAIRLQERNMVTDELVDTASQIDEWLENMHDLAVRIDRYQQERALLERDRDRTTVRLKQLEQEANQTQSAAIKEQIQTTMESAQRHLDTIQALDETIRRARLQLENSINHLGTIYSQTMLVEAKDIDRASARRMRQEIADEVTELNDMLGAMEEVYTTQTPF